MNRHERRERVKELRALGWSTPQIGRELGVDHSTVVRDLAKIAKAAAQVALVQEVGQRPAQAGMTQAAKYIAELQRLGPVAWAEGPNGWTGEDGQPITLTPWQRGALLTWEMHRQDVTTFAISLPKKVGKTFCDAVLLCWRWLALPGQHFACGNDLDQSQTRSFSEIAEMVRRNPFLSENVKAGKSELEFLLTGSRLTALAADATGNAGANFLTSSHTETWGILYENGIRSWEELTPPPGRFYGLPCLRVCDSYSGFTGESKVWHRLIDRGLAGERLPGEWPVYKAGQTLLFHMEGQEAQERCFRGSEAERIDYYLEQSESLRPNAYTRMHFNQRTAGESAFVTEEQWAACYSPDVHALAPGERVKLSFGADASVSHDFTALVGMDGDQVRYVKVWRPKRIAGIRLGKPFVDLAATIGAEVENLHAAGQVSSVTFDPWQLSSISRSWEKAGIRLHELPQGNQRTEADTALLTAIEGGRIRHFRNQELDEAIRNAVIAEGPRGIRIAKERASRRIDALVALSMAYSTALSGLYADAVVTTMPNPFYGEYADDKTKTFVQTSDGGYIIIPKDNAEFKHPLTLDAVRKCRWGRGKHGCPACIQFYEESGEYERQRQDAAARKQEGAPDYLAMAKQDARLALGQPEAERAHNLVSAFWKKIRQ